MEISVNFSFAIDFDELSSPKYFINQPNGAISLRVGKAMPYGLQSVSYGLTEYTRLAAATIAIIAEALFKSAFNLLGSPFNLLGFSFAEEFHLRNIVYIIPEMYPALPFAITSTVLFFISIPYLIYDGHRLLLQTQQVWTEPNEEVIRTTPASNTTAITPITAPVEDESGSDEPVVTLVTTDSNMVNF